MGAKKLRTELLFGGKVDNSLSRALKASESKAAKSSKKISKTMADSTTSMVNGMKSGFKAVANTALKVYGLVQSIAKLKDFAESSMQAAQDQIEVETKLETLLKNVGSITIRGPDAVEKATKRLIKVSDDLEKTGIIAGDVSLAGFQQLASFQLNDDTIAQLSGGMMDLLAQQKGLNATQSDAVSIANLVGKAMSGQTGSLSKVGIIFDENQEKILKTGTEAEKAAAMAKILQQNVGGVNEALAKTDSGKIRVAENLMGQMEEAFGNVFLSLKSKIVGYILPIVLNNLDKVQGILDKTAPKAEELIDNLFAIVGNWVSYIKNLYNDVSPSLKRIKDAAFEILNNLKGYAPAVSEFVSGTLPIILEKIIAIATMVLEVAGDFMEWEGFIPIIATIARTIALIKFVKLIKGIKDTVAAFTLLSIAKTKDMAETIYINALYAKDAIVKGANAIATTTMTVATGAWNTVCAIATGVTQAFGAAMAFLTSPIGLTILAILAVVSVVAILIHNWDAAKAKISEAVDAITSKVTSFVEKWRAVFEAISPIVDIAIDAVKSKIESVTSIFTNLGDKIKGLFDKITSLQTKSSTINVPGFSTGATVTSPTLAVVGEGKVPETIVPHNSSPRSRSLLATAAKGVGMSLSSGSRTYIFSPTIYAHDIRQVRESMEELYERFKAFMKQYEDEEDREVFA